MILAFLSFVLFPNEQQPRKVPSVWAGKLSYTLAQRMQEMCAAKGFASHAAQRTRGTAEQLIITTPHSDFLQ